MKCIVDELHEFHRVTVDEVALLKQTLILKDNEIARLKAENERLKKDNAILHKQNIKIQTKGM